MRRWRRMRRRRRRLLIVRGKPHTHASAHENPDLADGLLMAALWRSQLFFNPIDPIINVCPVSHRASRTHNCSVNYYWLRMLEHMFPPPPERCCGSKPPCRRNTLRNVVIGVHLRTTRMTRVRIHTRIMWARRLLRRAGMLLCGVRARVHRMRAHVCVCVSSIITPHAPNPSRCAQMVCWTLCAQYVYR